jgi:serine/threonine-protein kinase
VSAVVGKALAKTPEARFASAAEFATALERAAPASSAGALARYLSRRDLVAVTGAVLAAAAIGGTALLRSRATAPLDQHLVAVAPFEVMTPELAAWRERMVDQLSRSLDGAGPLRAVPTTTVLQRWRGRADLAGAVAFGHRTGAGLVVYGQLERSGRDSVTLTATLVDAAHSKAIAQTRRADVGARVDRAADQLTVAILRQAASSQGIRRAGERGFEPRSPAAMRAALAGEQFYRRAMWDSAIVRYKEAVELDSSFTLAQGRLGRVLAWHGDEDPNPFLLRAAHAPGLSWLDSMLITADSISAALGRSQAPLGLSPVVRLLLTADEAVWQRRTDAEAWYELGEARYHWSGATGTPASETLRAFERAIALDSGFAPAYVHSVELKLQEGDPAGALRYFDRLQALGATHLDPGTTARGQRYLLRAAVKAVPIDEDSVSVDDLRSVGMFSRWADSGVTTLSMARALQRKSEAAMAATAGGTDPASLPAEKDLSLALQVLAYKGQLAEVARSDVTDGLPSFGDLPPLMESVLLGAAPAERVERDLRSFRSTPDDEPRIRELSRWCGARGDTVCLRRILARTRRSGGHTLVPKSVVLDASADLALARHDTARALRVFGTLIDSLDRGMTIDLLQRARLLVATGKLDDARVQYSRATGRDGPLSVVAELELAEVAERRAAREQALESYRFVAATWKHADPILQPYVTRARAGLARLAAKPGA